MLHECPDDALALLDAAEANGHGYRRIAVEIESEIAPHNHSFGSSQKVSALTYIGMPQFIDNSCLPSRRYLNIVLEGARQAALNDDYIQALANQPTHQVETYPAFMPPPGDQPTFDRDSLPEQPLYTALYGAVDVAAWW